MASLPLSLSFPTTSLSRHRASPLVSLRFQPHLSNTRNLLRLRLKPTHTTRLPPPSAYVSGPGPGPDPIESDPDTVNEADELGTEYKQRSAISWGLLASLLSKHKFRILASVFSLVACTTCTLSMPIFSGRFFEVLIGKRPEPLWKLLSKIGLLYALEPIFTVIFVINMNTIWEKVMAVLRAQIFRRVLIQKVEFFDRYKFSQGYSEREHFTRPWIQSTF